MPPHPIDPMVRFMRHVDFDSAACWLWTGACGTGGYAVFNAGPDCRAALAHRWVYTALRGPIPAGLEIDHLCRVRHCVNPWHLEAVTAQTNQLRGESVSGKAARQTHCVHGHLLGGENLYLRRDRLGRQCRACRCRRERAYAAARKGGALFH